MDLREIGLEGVEWNHLAQGKDGSVNKPWFRKMQNDGYLLTT